jgi:hypothetical protein
VGDLLAVDGGRVRSEPAYAGRYGHDRLDTGVAFEDGRVWYISQAPPWRMSADPWICPTPDGLPWTTEGDFDDRTKG